MLKEGDYVIEKGNSKKVYIVGFITESFVHENRYVAALSDIKGEDFYSVYTDKLKKIKKTNIEYY